MKRSYKLNDLCCANCAAKIECDINKLDSVESARINFMTSRLTVEAATDDADALVAQMQQICSKYEPDCTIVH